MLNIIADSKKLRNLIPNSIKNYFRHFLLTEDYVRRVARVEDPNSDVEAESTYPAKVDVRLGIIKEFKYLHSPYISACRDLGVPYKLIDIDGPDWIDIIQNSGCDAFLVRPSAYITIWKQMYDERLKVMVEQLGKTIYPTYNEMWFYESKRRMHYWLEANNIPHPKTWVFYNRSDALKFADEVKLPIVYKSDLGSAASGVIIFKKRSSLKKHINKCFKKGIVRGGSDRRDRQWGNVVLQEFIPGIKEWRILKVGDAFYGHQKLIKGDFHSGSLMKGWYDPPESILEFTREIADKGMFTSMDVDIFETPDGRYLVNELQALFGARTPYQMLVNGVPGKYVYDPEQKQWRFVEGIYCQNACCTARVIQLLNLLGHNVTNPLVDIDLAVNDADKQASISAYSE